MASAAALPAWLVDAGEKYPPPAVPLLDALAARDPQCDEGWQATLQAGPPPGAGVDEPTWSLLAAAARHVISGASPTRSAAVELADRPLVAIAAQQRKGKKKKGGADGDDQGTGAAPKKRKMKRKAAKDSSSEASQPRVPPAAADESADSATESGAESGRRQAPTDSTTAAYEEAAQRAIRAVCGDGQDAPPMPGSATADPISRERGSGDAEAAICTLAFVAILKSPGPGLSGAQAVRQAQHALTSGAWRQQRRAERLAVSGRCSTGEMAARAAAAASHHASVCRTEAAAALLGAGHQHPMRHLLCAGVDETLAHAAMSHRAAMDAGLEPLRYAALADLSRQQWKAYNAFFFDRGPTHGCLLACQMLRLIAAEGIESGAPKWVTAEALVRGVSAAAARWLDTIPSKHRASQLRSDALHFARFTRMLRSSYTVAEGGGCGFALAIEQALVDCLAYGHLLAADAQQAAEAMKIVAGTVRSTEPGAPSPLDLPGVIWQPAAAGLDAAELRRMPAVTPQLQQELQAAFSVSSAVRLSSLVPRSSFTRTQLAGCLRRRWELWDTYPEVKSAEHAYVTDLRTCAVLLEEGQPLARWDVVRCEVLQRHPPPPAPLLTNTVPPAPAPAAPAIAAAPAPTVLPAITATPPTPATAVLCPPPTHVSASA
eukprot:TRINITY_DN19047_c0_g1_i2.p1 TRINITY_DN19047_c0_g1~~TRINITY_DN19047_c0_g1_i2.p1  ORF type:complete len:672 (+),score=206.58 TRINITY_DN19047_c0_g1_i2:40-2016(+)